jgi:hypothetical protein
VTGSRSVRADGRAGQVGGERGSLRGAMDLQRSDRTKSILWAVAMAPFVGVSIFFFILAAAHLETLRRIAARSPSATEGPVMLSGKVSRPSGLVRSPSGKSAAGWAAWIGAEDKDSRGRFRLNILCRQADLSDLELAGERRSATVDLVRPGDALDFAHGEQLDLMHLARGVIVHLVTFADERSGAVPEIPEPMRAACGLALSGARPETLLYNEQLLDVGQQVKILACQRDGRVFPCGDGVDAITIRSFSRGQRAFSKVLFIGQVWTLVFVASMGFSAAARAVRIRRTGR